MKRSKAVATIIDGKACAADIKKELRAETELLAKKGLVPGLAVVIVGDNPASKMYVKNKKLDCEECGYHSEEFALPADVGQSYLLNLVKELNGRDDIHGILVQLPLPEGYNEEEILLAVDPKKDVDAFHPVNVGKIMIGRYDLLPCTPAGVMELLSRYGVDPAGKRCVVLGRSNIVGKPQAMLLLHKNGTVTIAHSKTPDLASLTREADILVAAVGKARLVTTDMVKPGAAVIDVGMNRQDDGTFCGDVDFEGVSKVAGCITPVPGGVGPMTRAILMKNTLKAAKLAWGV